MCPSIFPCSNMHSILDLKGNVTNIPVTHPSSHRLLHNNSLSYISSSFSGWATRLRVFTTAGNPSECFRVLEPLSGVTKGICQCTAGFYGVDYCEPIAAFIRLPVFASQYGGLNITDSRIVSGSVSSAFNESSQIPYLKTFAVTVISPPATRSVDIPCVNSAFELDSSYAARVGAATRTLYSSQRELVLTSVTVRTNQHVPTNVTYKISNNNSANGLVVTSSTDGFVLEGAMLPRSGQNFNFTVVATELNSGEVNTVAVVTLRVQDCGSQTCSNGGVCQDDNDPYNNNFTCVCPAKFTGIRCNESVTAALDCNSNSCANNGTCIDDGQPYNRIFN